jgi:hypothetical protein
MSSFPAEYYIILAVIFVIPTIIVTILFVSSNVNLKTKGSKEKEACNCPSCKQDLKAQAIERTKVTGGTSVRLVCPRCRTVSDWDVSGFPFVLITPGG